MCNEIDRYAFTLGKGAARVGDLGGCSERGREVRGQFRLLAMSGQSLGGKRVAAVVQNQLRCGPSEAGRCRLCQKRHVSRGRLHIWNKRRSQFHYFSELPGTFAGNTW